MIKKKSNFVIKIIFQVECNKQNVNDKLFSWNVTWTIY